MRWRLLFFLLVLSVIYSLSSLPVSASSFLDSEFVTLDLHIDSGVRMSRTGPEYNVEYLTANVSLIPLSLPGQDVLKLDIAPKPLVSDDQYYFRWEPPVPTAVNFSIDARVKRQQVLPKVTKTGFPAENIPSDIMPYTLPRDIIDSGDPDIVAKSSELASGETDYYAVVFKMADWTKKAVDYDLSSMNRKASQKASWVLKNRNGVCDEITNLFIALLRAAGIPARFVSGIAYTESPQFPENWGPHGWAEVYFPGTGWVPFDVTYGEFGFVDPTHIVLKYSFDSGQADMSYSWLGRDVEAVPMPISVGADLVGQSGVVAEPVSVKLSMDQPVVGIGSHNLAMAEIENNAGYYVSLRMYIASIAEMELISPKEQAVMLEPFGTAKVFWVVKVIDGLDPVYTYTFPMTVATMKNYSASSSFAVIPGAGMFSEDQMQQVVEADSEESDAEYSKSVSISCVSDRESYYVYDSPELSCTVKNTGNFPFTNIKLCFDDVCKGADLPISQERVAEHVLASPKPGVNKVQFSVKGADISKSYFFNINVLDEPVITVSDITYPGEIGFGQPFRVAFRLKRTSLSVPENISVAFSGLGMESVQSLAKLDGYKDYGFDMDSGDLSMEPNVFVIGVNYHDANGRAYSAREEISINLIDVTFGQRLVIWLHDADRWLRNLFK